MAPVLLLLKKLILKTTTGFQYMKQIDMLGHINRIREEYLDAYDIMHWLSPEEAGSAERTREELVSAIFGSPDSPAKWRFSETKLFTHNLSPGCTLCGEGHWSCLFINGVCNAGCFYCPSEQKDKGQPITNGVEFTRARDYADYVDRFDIRGVGISGGEPLMTFERVVDYLKPLANQASRPLHIWMYTNGMLATQDKLKTLRDSGLNEIRFDLSANDYKLDSLEMAVGIIPIVTVEIPAIPEDLERTRRLIRDLHSAGVNHLNLHQIRCTQYNKSKLIQRGYTFVHGTGAAVLETELAALTLIRHALDQNIPLPINYCSFTFRDQFQKAAARRRNARLAKKPWEDVTPTGFIRTMRLEGDPDLIKRIRDRFQADGDSETLWNISVKGDVLSFAAALWHKVDFTGLRLKLTYCATALRSVATYQYPFTKIRLNEGKELFIERDNRHPGILLEGDDIQRFTSEFLQPEKDRHQAASSQLPPGLEKEIKRFECFDQGLAPYF